MPATLYLKKGSAKPLHAGHPWVFAGAVASLDGSSQPGETVRVVDDRGTCIGHAFYSPASALVARMVTRGDEPCSNELLLQRIEAAFSLRRDILKLGQTTDAYRLVNSEGDGLPGLIVDVYGDILAVQLSTAGVDRRRNLLLDALQTLLKPRAIMDRGDKRIRALEKLAPPESGALRGVAPEAAHAVSEGGLKFLCDLRPGHGQKTGLFLDQRENRRAFAGYAQDRDVLDLFSFSGAFAVHAAKAGAKSLTLADSSEDALKLAEGNLKENGIEDADLVCSEWPAALRHLREQNKSFDLMSVDPPKFARGQSQVGEALSAYRDLNGQVVRLLRPGGVLFTCSCSGTVSNEEFERAVASGISSAGRRATLLEVRGAGADHPVPPGFDQGRYLKCLVLRVD